MDKPKIHDTIADAKNYLRDQWEEGCECPACGQNVKLYHRKITSAMAYGLTLLFKHYQKTGVRVVHIEDFFKDKDCPSSIRGDFAKLRHWGLIEKMPRVGVGFYRITETGIDFVKGTLEVPRYVKIYNKKVYGFGNEYTNIVKALTDRFNLKELLGHEIRAENPKRNPIGTQRELL